jgi:phage-related protein
MSKPITVSIVGNAGPLKKSLNEADGFLGKFGGSLGKIGIAAGAAFAAAGAAAVAVGAKLIGAAEAASTANARIEQIAKSMDLFGDATSEVSNRLVKLAEKTALNTGVDQNAIKATQAKLLTFAELAKTADEVGGQFDRATQAAIDLAASGFGEATQNAVQLGKALNDPIKGITALARSGVTFTEVEKERIETLVASNKLGEAQTLILEAIEKQVGGTAVATANASDKMRVAFSQLQERLGAALLPAFERLTSFMLNDGLPALERFGEKVIPVIRDAFTNVSTFIVERVVPVVRDKLLPILASIADFIVDRVVPVVLDLWRRVFTGLAGIFDTVSKKMEENRENIAKLVEFLKNLSSFVINTVAPILLKTLSTAFSVVGKAIGPVIDVVFALIGALSQLGSFLVKVAGFVVRTFESMVNGVIDAVNVAIRLLNKLPGVDINEVGSVSFGGTAFGAAPTAPVATTPAPTVFSGSTIKTDGLSMPSVPTVSVPGFSPDEFDEEDEDTSTGGKGGGGGSKKGGGVSILPVDTTGFVGISPSTNIGGGGGGGFGAAMGTEALLDGMTGGGDVVNITVNTVTADANLPTLIVEALQTYNLYNGPVDVQIAV